MEAMRITLANAYHVMEQPGDGTRYQHLIVIEDDRAYVFRDKERTGGAGLQKPKMIPFWEALEFVERMDELGSDPHVQIEALVEYANGIKENPFTLASAFRCVDAIIKEYYTE